MFNEKAPIENNPRDEKLIMNATNKGYEEVFNKNNSIVDVDDLDKDIKRVENRKIDVQRNNPEVKQFEERKLNIEDSDIHHMPDKFLKPDKPTKKKNTFIILGISVLVVIVIAVGAFAYFALQEEPIEDNSVLNLNEGSTLDDEIEDIKDDLDLTTEEGRDLKRISDILDIKSALSLYYKDLGKYPYRLSSLKKYLSEMPTNPKPEGEEYYYEVEDSADIYVLRFTLESGGQFGNLILEAGEYELSSNFGISAYNADSDSEFDLEPEEEVEPEEEPDPEPDLGLLPIPPTGADDDNDYLTNTEELLFGTKFALPDSDFDGYLDGEELISLYDPLNDGGKLVDNTAAVHIYNNEVSNYSVLYPAKWSAEETSTDFKETIFYDDENGDFFKIQINNNPQNLTIRKWYLSFSPGAKESDLENFQNDNVLGVKTKDGFNIYIGEGNRIYIISYILVNTEELNYFQTFKMFINSFKIIES